MKLGTETNSLVNHLYSRAVIGQPQPVVGMGVTFLSWTDRNAGTIVEVVEEKGQVKRIACTHDESFVISGSGFDGSAEYRHEPRTDGRRSWFRIGRNGQWEQIKLNERNRWVKTHSGGLRIGERETYRDPSF